MATTASTRPIGLTGATGRLGGWVARLLAADGCPQRLLVRDRAEARRLVQRLEALGRRVTVQPAA